MDYFPLFGPRLEYPLKRIEIHTPPLPHREKKMPEILKIAPKIGLIEVGNSPI